MRFRLATIVVVLCVASLVAVAAADGRTRGELGCKQALLRGVLPVWARTGFSDPRPRLPHVLGRSGRIAALVFGYPLLSPPGRDRNNKILWVSRLPQKPLSDLRITARRMRDTVAIGPVARRTVVGGAGPSIINLPAPGCWRLTLRWSGNVDTLDLDYPSATE